MPGEYQKISINLSPQVLATVKAMAEADAVTVTEVLRRAISTHKFVEDAQHNGKAILLHDPDTKTTETRVVTTEADVHGASAVTSSAETGYRAYSGGASGGHSASSHNVSMRGIAEEQERGESVAEFSNAGHSREWRGGAAGYGASGYARHNAAYSTEDNRSIDSYETDNEGVFDKKTLVKHSVDVDPNQGLERFRNEMTTTKSSTQTYHK